ncbi:MAG: Unknown protein [uncultured Sulfurovum sp.]|uniref:Uncharacterized protein n=1 Tax=uncultured Sulfurovum sp. TaxID=269237 RepID=A0A6S6TS39_9BACT|nr:MAG: Unknown protein [uncultured Sulfurovum sp.]
MVLFSTSRSLKNEEISLLAIIEVIFAVGVYWGIAIYYNIYWHIILSISIVPFLLLQSKQSIELSLDKFHSYSLASNKTLFFSLFILLPLFSLGNIFYFKLDYILLWIFSIIIVCFYIILIFAILVFGLSNLKIESRIELASTMSSLYYSFIKIILDLLDSIRAKVVGTILNLRYGYMNITSNWFRRTFLMDMVSVPEIITGIENDTKSESRTFKVSKTWHYIVVKKEVYYESLKEYDIKMMWAFKISSIIQLIGIYFITLVYRISIKSTFWFYYPLILVIKKPNLTTSQDIGVFLSRQYETVLAKIGLLVSIGSLSMFIFKNLKVFEWLPIESSPIKPFLLLFYIDYSALENWKIIHLVLSLLIVVLYLYSDWIKKPYTLNNKPLKKDINVKTIIYLNNIKNLLLNLYLICAFIYVNSFFKILEYNYVPSFLNGFFVKLLELVRYVPFN